MRVLHIQRVQHQDDYRCLRAAILAALDNSKSTAHIPRTKASRSRLPVLSGSQPALQRFRQKISHDRGDKSYQICRSVPLGSLEHIQIDFTTAPLILGPPIEASSTLLAPRHPLDEGGVRDADARSTFLLNNTSYRFCAAGGIEAFLPSEDADEFCVVGGPITRFGLHGTGGGCIGGGATRRIESEGMDWVDEADDVAEERAGNVGFRAGRGGGGCFAGDVGGGLFVPVPVTAKAGIGSRNRGFLRGTYGNDCSGFGLGVVGTDLLLKAAMVSATDGVDTPSSGSPAPPSEDRETDWRDEVDSVWP
jgi:hypothetical protein